MINQAPAIDAIILRSIDAESSQRRKIREPADRSSNIAEALVAELKSIIADRETARVIALQ
jgi:hypothetical protein